MVTGLIRSRVRDADVSGARVIVIIIIIIIIILLLFDFLGTPRGTTGPPLGLCPPL